MADTYFKLGDKTFKSSGDPAKDIELIKQNFPDVDVQALSESLSGGKDLGASMAGEPPKPSGGIPDNVRAAAEHALQTGDKKQMANVKAAIDISKSLNPETATGPKMLPANQAVDLGEADTIPNILNGLQATLEKNRSVSGPIMGRIRSLNPYDDTAQGVQSEINAARQMVGKFLEGGVLRKEDESKYEKILPTLKDTPEAQLKKLMTVRDLVSSRRNSVVDSLDRSGYDVKSFLQQKLTQPSQSPQSAASGINVDQNIIMAEKKRRGLK